MNTENLILRSFCRLYSGIVSLGTVAKQVSIIGTSFQYIKNSLLKINDEKIYLTNEQIADYENGLKKTRVALDILEKELVQVELLSKVVSKRTV